MILEVCRQEIHHSRTYKALKYKIYKIKYSKKKNQTQTVAARLREWCPSERANMQ